MVTFDGMTLRGSFDNFSDTKARQVLSAFALDTALVLAHIEIDEKSNEIPAVQKLLELAGLDFTILSADHKLCIAAEKAGVKASNFNHFRGL